LKPLKENTYVHYRTLFLCEEVPVNKGRHLKRESGENPVCYWFWSRRLKSPYKWSINDGKLVQKLRCEKVLIFT